MDAKRKTVTTEREIFYLTGPTPLGELGKAIQVARIECARAKGVDVKELYDDDIMVASHDEEIHIYFEKRVES